MGNQVFSEKFIEKYDGVTNATLLPPGGIGGGGNVRKVSGGGGWKVRAGCALHNTTTLETGGAVKSLHYYKNPFNLDEHFLSQCNSKLLKESASNKLPPTQDTSYGVTLGVSVGTTPGFSATVGEWFFYADGSGRPVIWGGDSPRVKGFFVFENSTSSFIDYTRKVTDGRADTGGVILAGASDLFYVFSEEPISGVTLDLGSGVNSNAVTLAVKAWRSGAWTAVSGLSDGTLDAGTSTKTLAQDGVVRWTASSLDLMRVQSGILGYAYQFSVTGALSGAVNVVSVNAVQAAGLLTNKWNGEHEWVTGCRHYDQSLAEYQEGLGKVTNESTSQYLDLSAAPTDDFLYLKTPEPATAFGIGVVTGYGNVDAATVDNIEYWNGSAWTTIASGSFTGDSTKGGTKSFSQTGIIGIDGSAITPQMRTLSGDDTPGYWYRLSWSAAWSADTRIYACTYVPFPEVLPAYDGCVEFKGRLALWGDPEFPNRLRMSAKDHPTCFSGNDSVYTDAFGDGKKILCAIKFYNELVVFKEDSVWLLEGDNPGNFGTLKVTDKVGLASPKSAEVSEVGYEQMHTDEVLTVALWQDVDGIYTFDGRKTKKVSGAIDNFFDSGYAECIDAVDIRSCQAFVDALNNEYHFLAPDGEELVYNYITAEWYPLWSRKIPLACGKNFRASDNRFYTYGGSSSGFVMKLETDTTDKTTAGADEPIVHSVKTRALAVPSTGGIVVFTLRGLWAELKTRAAGSIVTKTFKDLGSTGVTQTVPSAMSMVKSGAGITLPKLDTNIERCSYVEVEFSLSVADQEMEIYGFGYELSGRGVGE